MLFGMQFDLHLKQGNQKIMKKIMLLCFVALSLMSFNKLHKFYVSVSEVTYVQEEKSVQIITRLFIDDTEDIIEERYEQKVLFGEGETKASQYYLEKYFKKKFNVSINGEKQQLDFLGKEIEDDMLICYIEIPNIEAIKSIEIQNQLLFDLTEEQQNIVHFDIYGKKKSKALRTQNDKGMLNF